MDHPAVPWERNVRAMRAQATQILEERESKLAHVCMEVVFIKCGPCPWDREERSHQDQVEANRKL